MPWPRQTGGYVPARLDERNPLQIKGLEAFPCLQRLGEDIRERDGTIKNRKIGPGPSHIREDAVAPNHAR